MCIRDRRDHRKAGSDRRLERDGRVPRLQQDDEDRREGRRAPRRDAQGARVPARRLRSGDRQVSPKKTNDSVVPRLKERYESELRPQLKEELGLSSIMQVPRLAKITLNMGVGEAKVDAKVLDAAMEELTIIAGQRPQMRLSLI